MNETVRNEYKKYGDAISSKIEKEENKISGLVNVGGEHALEHIKLDAPLTADIEGIAKPVSHWIKTCKSSLEFSSSFLSILFIFSKGSKLTDSRFSRRLLFIKRSILVSDSKSFFRISRYV